jgi:hypothetical protein
MRRKGMICDRLTDICMSFSKWQNREIIPVLILVPGSHECLALRKCVMCARDMGAQVGYGIWSTKGIKKGDEKSDSRAAEKGLKKLVSSRCVKTLEKESSN